MDISQILMILITVSGFIHGGKQDPDFNCQAAIEKLTHIIVEMNSTLQKTGEEKLSKISHTIIKRQTPEGAVSFSAYSTQRLTLGSQQTIIFDHVVTNLASGYDAQDGQFTAPFAGLYFFSSSLMATLNHYVHAEIVHNGATISYLFAAKGTFSYEDDTGTAVVTVVLQKGDKVWVRHRNDPSGVAQVEEYYSAFSGFLIQPM